jgi:aspartate 1-decarboxylase
MFGPDFEIVVGDRIPIFEVTLDGADDLTGATAAFYLTADPSGAVKINGAAATIANASTRVVQYAWASGDTDTAGTYEAKIVVTLASGKTITYPNVGGGWLVRVSP